MGHGIHPFTNIHCHDRRLVIVCLPPTGGRILPAKQRSLRPRVYIHNVRKTREGYYRYHLMTQKSWV